MVVPSVLPQLSPCVTLWEGTIDSEKGRVSTFDVLFTSLHFTALSIPLVFPSSPLVSNSLEPSFKCHFVTMAETIKEKLDRLDLLLQGDEDLQYLNTELRAKMAAHAERYAPQGDGSEASTPSHPN